MTATAERANTVRNWYALQTKPKQEFRAELNLKAWRVETFTPKIKGRRRAYSGVVKAPVIKPLFPGYIFARFNPETLLHKIVFTRGVQNVVSFGGNPTPVEDDIIDLMRMRATDDIINLTEEFKDGDKVVIQEGPFKDFVGVLDGHVKDDERVRILLLTISSQVHVTVARDWIKKQPR
jgi:transcriptional antiterminator RfaH